MSHHSSSSSLNDSFTENFDMVTEDLRTKRAARRNSGIMSVDDDTKMRLAKNSSHAAATTTITVPGAVDSRQFRVKPSQEQLEEMGNWRLIQKNRRAERNREEGGPEPLPADEEQPLEDLQSRMRGFQIRSNQNVESSDKMEECLKEKRRKRRTILKAAFVVAFFAAAAAGVALGVFGTVGGSSSSADEQRDGAAPITAFEQCYMGKNTDQSARFMELRSVILASSPSESSELDSVGSAARQALCWLSYLDTFGIEVVEGSEYDVVQRFAMATICYHFAETTTEESSPVAHLNWLSEAHVCEWDFVSCDGPNDRVSELFLNEVPLNKFLAKEITLLTSLVYLRLSDNRLTGRIPAELSRLTQLKILDLSLNRLTGTIPLELSGMTNLTLISFARNMLTGTIPYQLFSQLDLDLIDLGTNRLTGTLPSELGSASALTEFGVSANVLTGSFPDISQLSNLEGLWLNTNIALGGPFPDISRCTNLESLRLDSTDLTGTIIPSLWSLRKLKVIMLGNTFLTGTIPAEAAQLTDLVNLSLESSRLSGSIPSTFGNLLMLESLSMGLIPRATGTIPTELGHLTNLHTLVVAETVEGRVPTEICALREHSLKFLQGPPCARCDCCTICS